jgi:vacuolar-type H+-ATPase subunit I/STV1
MADPGADVPWRDYVDTVIVALRREATLQHASTEQAIEKSDHANEKRFTSVEDLRLQLGSFVTREVADGQFLQIRSQLVDLAALKANELLQRERIDGLRRETETLRLSSETAITKSEESVEKRFSSVNEFRAQLNDQAQRFALREVVDSSFKEITSRIEAMRTEVLGRIEAANKDALARIESLQQRTDRTAGVTDGNQQSRASMYATIGAIAAVIVIVNVLIAVFGGR